jgi:ketosteroid isomerase-like protein
MAASRPSEIHAGSRERLIGRQAHVHCGTTFDPAARATILRKEKWRPPMSTEENVQTVKNFFAAMGSYNKQDLLTLAAEDIEWIIPGKDWPLAGTHRGHAALAAVLQKASEAVETAYTQPPEFVAQGDRVLVVGVATGKIKATNKPFRDDWVFDITVRGGKVKRIREYIDTQALAQAARMDASASL